MLEHPRAHATPDHILGGQPHSATFDLRFPRELACSRDSYESKPVWLSVFFSSVWVDFAIKRKRRVIRRGVFQAQYMNFILDLVSSNRVMEILEQLRKEGIDTSRTDKIDGSLLVDEKDLPQALEILKRLGI
jgi:hypothetical protein